MASINRTNVSVSIWAPDYCWWTYPLTTIRDRISNHLETNTHTRLKHQRLNQAQLTVTVSESFRDAQIQAHAHVHKHTQLFTR